MSSFHPQISDLREAPLSAWLGIPTLLFYSTVCTASAIRTRIIPFPQIIQWG